MTIHLYDKDSELLEFDATVLSCEEKGEQYIVTLDRTAFFPEGGGQGADHGMLGKVHVLDAHEVKGEVQHLTDGPLEVGTIVHGCVDAQRRLAMMQQHSGEHIFSGLVHQLFGYDNVGFHIGSEAVTMDFSGPLTDADVLRVERLANEIIWKNIPVVTLLPSADELAAMEYRSKKALTGEVRIVVIEGADTCACCGTHVKLTGSIGQIKVLSCQKYKSGVRVSILCGMRALDEENMLLAQVRRASAALSCKQHEVADSVDKLLDDRDRLRAQSDALGMRVFDMMAEKEMDSAVRVVACDVLPAAQARKAAGKLAAGAKAALVLISREDGYSFAMSSESLDVRPLTKALCETFGGRGGGPKDMTQGVLGAADKSAIREKLSEMIE